MPNKPGANPEKEESSKGVKCNRCKFTGKSVKHNGVDCCPECFAPRSWQA